MWNMNDRQGCNFKVPHYSFFSPTTKESLYPSQTIIRITLKRFTDLSLSSIKSIYCNYSVRVGN